MIFATDAQPGNKIMSSIYKSARVKGIPELQSQAKAIREKKRREGKGLFTLFDPGASNIKTQEYVHTPPWRPPSHLAADVPIDESPPSGEADETESWPSPDGS
jgi:hypothetical protein